MIPDPPGIQPNYVTPIGTHASVLSIRIEHPYRTLALNIRIEQQRLPH